MPDEDAFSVVLTLVDYWDPPAASSLCSCYEAAAKDDYSASLLRIESESGFTFWI